MGACVEIVVVNLLSLNVTPGNKQTLFKSFVYLTFYMLTLKGNLEFEEP